VWSGSYGGHDVWRLRPPKLLTVPLTGHEGTVRLIAVSATKTLVTVTAPGEADGEPVHVHGGRCDAFTASAIPAFALRGGRAAKVVSVAFARLASGRYALDIHTAAGNTQYVACANLG
jgi:hypothetical protein